MGVDSPEDGSSSSVKESDMATEEDDAYVSTVHVAREAWILDVKGVGENAQELSPPNPEPESDKDGLGGDGWGGHCSGEDSNSGDGGGEDIGNDEPSNKPGQRCSTVKIFLPFTVPYCNLPFTVLYRTVR